MKTILVVDDMPIFRDAIAAALKAAGYQCITASNGAEAIETIRARKPDLVLLDVGMPVLDGLAALTILRGRPATADLPIILLTALSDKDKVLQAAKLGIRDYLLKSRFSLAELLERIRLRLADDVSGTVAKPNATAPTPQTGKPTPSPTPTPAVGPRLAASGDTPATHQTVANTGPIPQLLTRQACLARAGKAMEGKSLSGIVAQVISMAMSPRTDAPQLAAMIARDPTLAAKVLRVANSPVYASRGGPKTTILEAVRNIGASTVRTIAAALGVFEAMSETSADGYNPIRCWQHSFAVARLCEHFAALGRPEHAPMAYLVGLCHDLVEIMLHAQFGPEYAQVLEWEARTGKTRRELEKAMLGVESGELVVKILKHLALPEAIQHPIEAWHTHASKTRSDDNGPLIHLLRLAEFHANGLQLASAPTAAISPVTVAECRAATGQDHPHPPDAEALRGEVLALTAMLSRLPPAEEAKLMLPLYPLSKHRACLVREASISACDPVEKAIGSMAAVTSMDQVPPVERLKEFQSLIVAAASTSAPGLTRSDLARIRAQSSALGLRLIWLVRGSDTADVIPGVTIVPWPTTLKDLAEALGLAEPDQKLRVA